MVRNLRDENIASLTQVFWKLNNPDTPIEDAEPDEPLAARGHYFEAVALADAGVVSGALIAAVADDARQAVIRIAAEDKPPTPAATNALSVLASLARLSDETSAD